MTEVVMENYTKAIKGRLILDKVSLHMHGGMIYGLKGVNGSGKTMILRAICGLIHPDAGSVTINGEQLFHDISFPRSVSALIENPAFLDSFTGLSNLEMIASLKEAASQEDIRKALEDVGLDPQDKRTYRKYSLGMKQKLGIACALMEKPDIILLDEPFNALDEESVKKVKNQILRARENGQLIVLATHDGTMLEELADEIFVIEEGRVVNQLQKGNAYA